MSPLTLHLLGSPRVEIDDKRIDVKPRKALALLIYLACTREVHARDKLATLFWPESNQQEARAALRRRLSELKRQLGDGWLEIDRESVSIARDADIRVDAHAFAKEIEEARQTDQLAQAVELYRDDFLSGFNLPDCSVFDDWVFFEAENLRGLLSRTLTRLVDELAGQEQFEDAIPHARRLLALDPLHEPTHRTLIQLYAQAGQQSAALRQYDECVRMMDEEFGAPPEEETVALIEAVRGRGLESKPSKSKQSEDKSSKTGQSTEPKHNNFPSQSTEFFGRHNEIRSIHEMFEDSGCRLISIVGPGGIGKTRLAIQAALQMPHSSNVTFVPLVDLPTPDAIPKAIADALMLEDASDDLMKAVIESLSAGVSTLVLDNFEHLTDGAIVLSELLGAVPTLMVIVTSRERLNLQEEWVFPLEGLSFPPSDVEEELTDFESVKFFVQRTRQHDPSFSLIGNHSAVMQICQIVQGMPLALTLAATWVRMMPCTEIAKELTKSLDLLETRVRNIEARHQSMRAVFEYSWALLTENEQEMFKRISVFRNGFTLEAATFVTEQSAMVLMSLIDKSLIQPLPSGRFEIHELIRQFATEKLTSEPHSQSESRERHITYYGNLLSKMPWSVHEQERHTDTEESVESMGTALAVAADIHNIRAVWDWAVQIKNTNTIEQMMNAAADYFRELGGRQEGHKFFGEAVAAFREDQLPPSEDIVRILGSLLYRQSWFTEYNASEESIEILTESISLLEAVSGADDDVDLALALVALGPKLGSIGQNEEAEKRVQEGVERLYKSDSQLALGNAFIEYGLVLHGWGRLADAATALQRAIEILERKNKHRSMMARFLWANIKMLQGEYDIASLEVTIQVCRQAR